MNDLSDDIKSFIEKRLRIAMGQLIDLERTEGIGTVSIPSQQIAAEPGAYGHRTATGDGKAVTESTTSRDS